METWNTWRLGASAVAAVMMPQRLRLAVDLIIGWAAPRLDNLVATSVSPTPQPSSCCHPVPAGGDGTRARRVLAPRRRYARIARATRGQVRGELWVQSCPVHRKRTARINE